MTREIVDFVRIRHDVIKRLSRFRSEKLRLCRVQFSGIEQRAPLLEREHLVAVIILQTVGIVRLIIADILEPAARGGGNEKRPIFFVPAPLKTAKASRMGRNM